MNTEDKLRKRIALVVAGVPVDRISHFAWTCDWSKAGEILAIPELKKWAMEKWDLVPNGMVNLSTLPIKKRARLIITEEKTK